MEKKYKLTEESISFNGRTLYRIESLRDFGLIKKGQKGGFIESEYNLSHEGDSWVYDDAKVYDNAEVCGNARVLDNAKVSGNAMVSDNAWVFGNAMVFDNAKVSGNAKVSDNAWVFGNANVSGKALVSGNAKVSGNANVCADEDYIVFKNWWGSGRHFTWTRSNNMWKVGCFYGTGEELIKNAYKDSEKSGREYERVVKYVESILADEKK